MGSIRRLISDVVGAPAHFNNNNNASRSRTNAVAISGMVKSTFNVFNHDRNASSELRGGVEDVDDWSMVDVVEDDGRVVVVVVVIVAAGVEVRSGGGELFSKSSSSSSIK
jgi:hypothetical protein